MHQSRVEWGKILRKISLFVTIIIVFNSLSICTAVENELGIASVAGYKKVVEKIFTIYKEKNQKKIVGVFGNMQQIRTQVSESGLLKIIIGDKSSLTNDKILKIASFYDLGEGKLVIAYGKKYAIKDVSDLRKSTFTKIGLPNTKNAIYGIAALEYLNSKGLYKDLENKLLQVDTVPQVTSYIVANEIDCGFINLSDAIGLKDSIGGYVIINDGYSPIIISAGVIAGYDNDKDVIDFINFLKTKEVKDILEHYGL